MREIVRREGGNNYWERDEREKQNLEKKLERIRVKENTNGMTE